MLGVQLIIFDTEFTAWPGSSERQWSEPWEHRELIQLAAVKVSIANDLRVTVVNSFNEIIKPVKNPTLSDYIVSLTGISQSVIDEMGVDFSSALTLFHQFADEGQLPCFAWGTDELVLRENCQLYGVSMPTFASGFANMNTIVKRAGILEASLCSGDLARHLKLDLHGHNHNALYDVRSIALALDYWLVNKRLSPTSLQVSGGNGGSKR